MAKEKTIPEKIEEAVVEAVEKFEEKADEILEDVKEKIGETVELASKKKGRKKLTDEEKEARKAEREAKKKAKKEEKASPEETKKKSKLEELKERAKKLQEGLEEKDIKGEVEEAARKQGKTLLPLDDYVKSGIHLGTKVITPNMRKYVYRRRADGLAVLNTNLIDEKIKEAIEFIKKYTPDNIIFVCKREAGWHACKLFEEATGIKTFTKKYPAGIITNILLEDFFEPELIMICDPWLDKNALNDALKTKKKVLALCDSNNLTNGVDQMVPCNNKSNKSIGLVLYLLARGYNEERKIDKKLPDMEIWTGELEDNKFGEIVQKDLSEKKLDEKIEVSEEVKEGV